MKKLLSLLLAGALALSLVACGSSEPAPEAEGEGEGTAATETTKSPDNDIVVALQADTTSMDPHVGSNGISNQILNEVYETLLTFDEDTNVVPLLAKDWEVSEDGRTYTFYLNEGITFHDGEPFNAESVVAVYERGLADDSLTLKRTIGTTDAPIWESVVAVDEYTVAITLVEPNNTFINKICQFRIASPKAMAMENATDWFAKKLRRYRPICLHRTC